MKANTNKGKICQENKAPDPFYVDMGKRLRIVRIKANYTQECKFCSNGTPILKSAVHSF